MTISGLHCVESCVNCHLRSRSFFCDLSHESIEAFNKIKHAAVFPEHAREHARVDGRDHATLPAESLGRATTCCAFSKTTLTPLSMLLSILLETVLMPMVWRARSGYHIRSPRGLPDSCLKRPPMARSAMELCASGRR